MWAVPALWKQSDTAFIIGGGPSLKGVDLTSALCDKRVIGVNDAFLLGDWVDVCFFGDFGWYEHWRQKLVQFENIVVTNTPHHGSIPEKSIMKVKRNVSPGLDTRSEFLCWNSSSGAAAVNLAYHLGVKKVVLLGFDMQLDNIGDSNWHPNDIHKANPRVYSRFIRGFRNLQKDIVLKNLDFKLINANPNSALHWDEMEPLGNKRKMLIPNIPKITLKEALKC